MAWKAKITGIAPKVMPYLPEGQASLQYEISAQYYEENTPALTYTRVKTVPYSVTADQVLNFIKAEIAALNSGDVLPTTVGAHLNEEIDANTTW